MKSFFLNFTKNGVISKNSILGTILLFLFTACTSYPEVRHDVSIEGVFNTKLGKEYSVLGNVEQSNKAVIASFVKFKKSAEVYAANFSGASRKLYSTVASHNVPTYVYLYDYDISLPSAFSASYPVKAGQNTVYVYVWVSSDDTAAVNNKTLETAKKIEKSKIRILINYPKDTQSSLALPYDEDIFIEEVKKRL